jgi:hypothetical protein
MQQRANIFEKEREEREIEGEGKREREVVGRRKDREIERFFASPVL